MSEVKSKIQTEEAKAYICDNLCEHPKTAADQAALNELCNKCNLLSSEIKMRSEAEIKKKLEEVLGEYQKFGKKNLHYAGNIEALEWVLGILKYLD